MSKSIFRVTLLAPLGAAALLPTTVPAAAATYQKVSHEVVYGDLNLKSDADVARLQQRIRSAARKVCGGHVDLRNIAARQAADRCQAAAVAHAQPKIDLAVANARSGQSLAAAAAIEVGEPRKR